MIGRITGVLIEKQAPDLLVDVQGVGYEVLVSMNTFFTLPGTGDSVTLHTHFVVREDAQQLFGFATREERLLFRSLVKVSGVGPKMALAILSGLTVAEFILCVQRGDVTALTRAPGVGKKTAERLVVELKDRLASLTEDTGQASSSPAPVVTDHRSALEDAETALVALGFKPQEAARMISRARKELGEGELGSEVLIRAALKSTMNP